MPRRRCLGGAAGSRKAMPDSTWHIAGPGPGGCGPGTPSGGVCCVLGMTIKGGGVKHARAQQPRIYLLHFGEVTGQIWCMCALPPTLGTEALPNMASLCPPQGRFIAGLVTQLQAVQNPPHPACPRPATAASRWRWTWAPHGPNLNLNLTLTFQLLPRALGGRIQGGQDRRGNPAIAVRGISSRATGGVVGGGRTPWLRLTHW